MVTLQLVKFYAADDWGGISYVASKQVYRHRARSPLKRLRLWLAWRRHFWRALGLVTVSGRFEILHGLSLRGALHWLGGGFGGGFR